MSAVAIVGSVHMDVVARAARLPRRGETMPGSTFAVRPGGKAANQAVQVARQGLRSLLIARVGRDDFGEELLTGLEEKGVDVSRVLVDEDVPTGASAVLVGEDGDYASIVVSGASMRLSEGDLEAARSNLAGCSVLLTQMEVGIGTVTAAVTTGKELGMTVVLNAAPAPPDPDAIPGALWRGVDVLVVNEVEAAMLAGVAAHEAGGGEDAARFLLDRLGAGAVVATLGADGAVLADAAGEARYPGYRVRVVETLGAGDAFAGTLASELARGTNLRDAVRSANAAGALAVTKEGAYDAMPSEADVRRLLVQQPRG